MELSWALPVGPPTCFLKTPLRKTKKLSSIVNLIHAFKHANCVFSHDDTNKILQHSHYSVTIMSPLNNLVKIKPKSILSLSLSLSLRSALSATLHCCSHCHLYATAISLICEPYWPWSDPHVQKKSSQRTVFAEIKMDAARVSVFSNF